MVSRLLTEISAYFEYLARQHGDYVAFHNVKIPMEGYMAQLAPYNICLLYTSFLARLPGLGGHARKLQF